jgi:adenylate cyclase
VPVHSVERKLAAILSADAVGYSRLMGEDEPGTLARLTDHRRELIDPRVAEHKGRIVKTAGDGILIEFPSVVEAVACAVAVQHGMAERNAVTPEEQRIVFRIGVNLGDIIIGEDNDIHGDGVNIAVRLEAIAEPGGICISGTVRDHVGDRLDLVFEDMGERALKNIARPVRVYALRPEAGDGSLSAPAATSIAGAIAPRLSIVVLPFANLGKDPEQQYFADGITEDLTTDLSRIVGSFVISRNTAFTYRDKPVETKQIGRELSVRYVLQGSVRRSGNQVRVNAQLIDAESDAHLWVERFDRDIGDLFALQNEITSRIAVSLNFVLVEAEAARPTTNPDALDYVFRARAISSRPPTRDGTAERVRLFEQALMLDPTSAEVQSRLAFALTGGVNLGMSGTVEADLTRAERLIEQAMTTSSDSAFAYWAKGQLLRARGRYAEAIPEYEAAISLDRNLPGAYANLGQTKLFTGALEAVIPFVEQAIRLSPRDPDLGYWFDIIGLTHLLESRIDEAVVWLEKARRASPARPIPRVSLAAAYGLKGERERAAAELAEARRLSGNPASLSTIASWTARRSNSMAPKVRALYEATYDVGLRNAGMPKE